MAPVSQRLREQGGVTGLHQPDQPGRPHAQGAADDDAGDHDEQALVGRAAPPDLEREDRRAGRDAGGHAQAVHQGGVLLDEDRRHGRLTLGPSGPCATAARG